MIKKRFKNYVLVLLALLFAAPGVLACLLYMHPEWLVASLVNKGSFIQPPSFVKFNKGLGKWAIVFWSPGACQQECIERVNLLARVRLALGRKLYEVEQWLVLSEQSPSLQENTRLLFKKEDVHTAKFFLTQSKQLASLSADPRIFLVNPEGYFILSYSEQANPSDVYSDLKRLLDTSQN